jgi:glyoxylase-like metal-dependent hydrolase (beta-lactamase superfamily II)
MTPPSWIRCLTIPTPFPVGPVNVYLLEDEPLTLVDTGPSWPQALAELENALAAYGRRIEDLELVLLTHQHFDHFGLAGTVRERSGAEVAALAPLVEFARDAPASVLAEQAFRASVMALHGVPASLIATAHAQAARGTRFAASVDIGRPLCHGATLEFAHHRLHVAHRPGHSPTDTVFVEERERIAIVGDHLIAHISSNPTVHRPLGRAPDPRQRDAALLTYLESLAKTATEDHELLLSGHGESIHDHRTLAAQRMRLHRRRAEQIHSALRKTQSAYEIAARLWPSITAGEVFLMISEVLGHLDLLVSQDRARAVEAPPGQIRYVATN